MTDDPYRVARNADPNRVVRKAAPSPEVTPMAAMSPSAPTAEAPVTLLQRVQKRIETDLDAAELQSIVDEATSEVVRRYGPNASDGPITVRMEGRTSDLVLDRPLDVTATTLVRGKAVHFFEVVTEYLTEYGWGETPYMLTSTDYRIWPGGSILERLTTGPNSRSRWADQVGITYIPINDDDQREEVIVKLAILAVQYDGSFPGLGSKRVGEVSMSAADYQTERDKLLDSLMPRGSLFMK